MEEKVRWHRRLVQRTGIATHSNPPVPQIMHQRGPTAWNYGGVGGFLCRPTPMAWHRQYGSVPRLHLPGYISPSSSSRWSHFHRHFRFHRSSFVPSLGAVLGGVPAKTRIRIKFFSNFAGHNEAFVSAAASKEQGGMTFCRLPRTPPGAWLSVSPEKAQVPDTLQGKGESHSGLQRSATVVEVGTSRPPAVSSDLGVHLDSWGPFSVRVGLCK